MAQVLSPGMFHASTAFLPSSFAMYTTMAGMACFMNWRGGIKTSQAIFWFALGGAIGWPFATALGFPFIVEEIIFAFLAPQAALGDWIMRMIRGTVAGALAVVSPTFPIIYCF
jgi:alpha-1,2-mannosyltransferase